MLDRSALQAAAAPLDVAPTDAFLDAWRQLHYAAQIASEMGKSRARARADDSHSNFAWRAGELIGAATEPPRVVRAALRVRDLTLRLVGADGAELAARPLDGATFAAGMRWMREQAEQWAGPPRQAAVAASDLPPHPIANGAPFAASSESHSLARLLDGAAALLRAIASDVAVWPHHFDMAVLRDAGPERTIGVGLAMPDTLEASGYWYVSPWSATPPVADETEWPALAHGRWVARGGALPMAAFPLADFASLAAATRRHALVDFLVATYGACERNLAR